MNAFTLFCYHAMGQLNENIEWMRTEEKRKNNDWINQNFMLH
jgi:hypothetical protein